VPAVDVAWITYDDVVGALGQAPSASADVEWLGDCVAAANVAAFETRLEAGYVDDPLVVPDAGVKVGTVQYAVAWYRSRGSAEGYGSFDEFGNFTPAGATWAMIRKAWRVPRMGFG